MHKFLLLFPLFIAQFALAQQYHNPIVRGFNPDPSICRVGDDYYLVTSTFEYFPGVLVYHSKDLVNWKTIGHVLDRPSQLNLEGFASSDGIYAPTIRHHKGVYYVVTSLVSRNPRKIQNIIMTATDPAGPWSNPVVLTDSSLWSIDPSLFFDDDGKCYFVANRKHQVKQPYPCYREIAMQELDLEQMKLVVKIKVLGSGASKKSCTAEGPHIYKKDGYYYLLVSEGGTGQNHAVTMSRSKEIFGDYKQFGGNPVLTHRHLQSSVNIRNVGHADIVQTPDGEWWMTCLGVRHNAGYTMLGRETFLVPMEWPKGKYPIVSPGDGQVRKAHLLPSVAEEPNMEKWSFHDDFETEELSKEWTYLRTKGDFLDEEDDTEKGMVFKLQPVTLTELSTPSFLGKRVTDYTFEASTLIGFDSKKENEEAGIVLIYNEKNHVRLIKSADKIRLVKVANGKQEVIAESDIALKDDVKLKVSSNKQRLKFFYASQKGWEEIGELLDGKFLNARGFTGTFVGLYGSSNGEQTKSSFEVEWFDYRE